MSDPSLKILHINLARGWRGGEEQTWQLMQRLRQQGIDQAVCAYATSPMGKRASQHGYTVIPPYLALISPWIGRRWDVLHAHDGRGVYAAAWLNRFSGSPYIITRRDPRRPTDRQLTRRVYRGASALVGVSSQVTKTLRQMCPDSKVLCITSVHSGGQPNVETTCSLRERWLGSNQFLIGHAGALVDKHKGQSVLIEAVRQLNCDGFRAQLILMGTGPDQKLLQDFADDDPAIHFAGYVDPVQDALAALDLFVFPSNYEALGSVLLEAMLSRTPIVATNVGGIPDLIQHEVTGLLCPPGDSKALMKMIAKALDNEPLRNQLSLAASDYAKTLGPESMAKQYTKIYSRISGYRKCDIE